MATAAEHAPPAPPYETNRFPLAPLEDAVIALARVWSNLHLYPPGHPAVAEQLDEAEHLLGGVLDAEGELTLKRLNGELLCGSHRLFANRPRPAGFLGVLGARGIDCITVTQGLTVSELATFCGALVETPEEGEDLAPHPLITGVDHILIDELGIVADDAARRTRPFLGMPLAELYSSAIACARQTMHAARTDQPIDVSLSMGVVEELVGRVIQDRATAMGLACVKGHDEYTLAHSVHVALLSVAFGDAIGLTEDELHDLGAAALLHDVGKVFVPTEVLRKPGKLTSEEWELMHRHPIEGAAVILGCRDLPAAASVVAFEHHLHCDLTGYPHVRRRREISLWGMIVSLADIYDALTSCRPYRPALPPPEAAAELGRMANGKCDPRLVVWFREMLGLYPPGTCVRLDTGECGVVCRSHLADPARPTVWVFLDAEGRPLLKPHEVRLDEMIPGSGNHRRSIVETTPSAEALARGARALDAWLRLQSPGSEAEGANG